MERCIFFEGLEPIDEDDLVVLGVFESISIELKVNLLAGVSHFAQSDDSLRCKLAQSRLDLGLEIAVFGHYRQRRALADVFLASAVLMQRRPSKRVQVVESRLIDLPAQSLEVALFREEVEAVLCFE